MLELASRLHTARARDAGHKSASLSADRVLRQHFSMILPDSMPVDAQFVDSSERTVVGAAGLAFKAPVMAYLLKDPEAFHFLKPLWQEGMSVLIMSHPRGTPVSVIFPHGQETRVLKHIPQAIQEKIGEAFRTASFWAGTLNDEGHHVIDLKSPSPGPHFFVNLLLGNRIGFEKPLQTTPKSVVDRLGHGSFRSHAATQVLATRWDMRPEENGFPANRQFYLVEDGRQIFYSAAPNDSNVEWAQAVHAQNRTRITYRTHCGLEIVRLIFLLPHEDGLPLASEVQSIFLFNHSNRDRHLRLVVTGMFGAASPGALQEDVVYTNLAMQASVLKRSDGSIAAISPNYNSAWNKEDVRFHAMVVHQGKRLFFPDEFCSDYNEFVGRGTMEHPECLLHLSNRLARKGPGFFALAANVDVPIGDSARVDNFTGLVSGKLDPAFDDESLSEQVELLLDRYSAEGEVDRALERSLEFLDRYSRHVQVDTGNPRFDQYFNRNLPFQILYQTFLSRSFCQTQKGYREIGFREIQDLFASMPYFISMGHSWLVKDLLKEWASQIYEFGYANHNFYWKGKEPGEFSDDALWFVQALDIYVNHTGDMAFLDEQRDIAGSDPTRQRSIYETVKAILRYSGEISIGKHRLPLLDKADWNDTLRLDYDYLNGPQKEAAYNQQLESHHDPSKPFESDYSESVMNAFLLKVALDAARKMASRRGDSAYAEKLEALADRLRRDLQQHAWKGNFFARVLFNRYADGRYAYLGARGDDLSADPAIDGTYFLNSFNWSILADVATEEQIGIMLNVIRDILLTPHGLKLCSPVNYSAVSERGGSGEYFAGDRENGGVFKHANMMGVAAMLKAAKTVKDRNLAAELRDLAYRIVDLVMPFRTMDDPFVLCGNPRFCTQYNNSETGENVGPLLSGTATWLWLSLMAAYGIKITAEGIELDPILKDIKQEIRLSLNTGKASYRVKIAKPNGFCRVRDEMPLVQLDGLPVASNRIPLFKDGKVHRVNVVFGSG